MCQKSREKDKEMIKPCCIICSKELNEAGAILLASPVETGMCAKYHICVKCEKILCSFITGLKLRIAIKNHGGITRGR